VGAPSIRRRGQLPTPQRASRLADGTQVILDLPARRRSPDPPVHLSAGVGGRIASVEGDLEMSAETAAMLSPLVRERLEFTGVSASTIDIWQHADEHGPQRPVLLAVDQ
jgi:hypothetical protein